MKEVPPATPEVVMEANTSAANVELASKQSNPVMEKDKAPTPVGDNGFKP